MGPLGIAQDCRARLGAGGRRIHEKAGFAVADLADDSADPPGNYWIVDLDPDYQWAIVSDPTGYSGFFLSLTRTVSPDLYQELLDRAAAQGVQVGSITPTEQF